MRVSRERLLSSASELRFRPEILEKVIHLLSFLGRLNSHPYLKGRLALKGGTALNLFYYDVPRLSVDIDLNYIGSPDRDTMLAERPEVDRAMRGICSRENYAVHRMPSDHAGGKWSLRYDSALGQGGNLELDMNFMYRVPLWPVQFRDSCNIGSYSVTSVPILDLHELAAGKLAALLSRHTARDLFDAHRLLTEESLNMDQFRTAFVLYGAMNRKDWRTVTRSDIGFETKELEDKLLPVVRADFLDGGDTVGWASLMVSECQEALGKLLPLSDSESAFLDALLDYAEIKPQLLTNDEDLTAKILAHPSLQWKAQNVREFRGL